MQRFGNKVVLKFNSLEMHVVIETFALDHGCMGEYFRNMIWFGSKFEKKLCFLISSNYNLFL